ncbi:hypothetical protein GCM10010368_26280 [Streptomyces roseiscleroticus]|uniref:Uncharacterized protein n=1 Tax=Streptomyces roseiscleroticus TaxID=1972 RepID=A0ABN3EHH2_9ACTN
MDQKGRIGGSTLRIAVSDPRDGQLPYVRRAARADTSGRGLVIVREVAGRWASAS